MTGFYCDCDGIWHARDSRRAFADFDPAKHPRDEHGRWASVGHGPETEALKTQIAKDITTFIQRYPGFASGEAYGTKDTPGGEPNPLMLRHLIDYIGSTHEKAINAMLDREQKIIEQTGGKGRAAVLVMQEPATVWALNWPTGVTTRPHDHGGSSLAVHVTRGNLSETVFDRGDAQTGQTSRTLTTGQGVQAGPFYLHTMMNNSPEQTSSIHVYYPSLHQVSYFGAKGLEVDRFTDGPPLGERLISEYMKQGV